MDVMRHKLEREVNQTLFNFTVEDDVETLKLSKQLLRACIDLDARESRGVEPLERLIEEMGGWPVVKRDSWDESLFSWQKIAELAIQNGLIINFPLTFSSMANTAKNSSVMVLQVS